MAFAGGGAVGRGSGLDCGKSRRDPAAAEGGATGVAVKGACEVDIAPFDAAGNPDRSSVGLSDTGRRYPINCARVVTGEGVPRPRAGTI